jgi:hypothetical protein
VGSGKENGEAVFFVAREGAALPLVDFDFKDFEFDFKDFDFMGLATQRKPTN